MINYAPYIEGILPAFASRIKIPFKMNAAVSNSQVKGFLIKFMQLDGTYIGYQSVTSGISSMVKNEEVVFNLRSDLTSKIITQNFYKIQLAYMHTNSFVKADDYTFSTVGIIKRTKSYKAPVWAAGTETKNNLYLTSYNLTLKTEDVNEPIYRYYFTVTDTSSDRIVYKTKWQIHNAEADTITKDSNGKYVRTAVLHCNTNRVLPRGSTYVIKCYLETVNKYIFSEASSFKKPKEVARKLALNLVREHFYYYQGNFGRENGCVVINSMIYTVGNYAIKRLSSKDGYATWQTIANFAVTDKNKNTKYKNSKGEMISYYQKIVRDFTIEQGERYRYVLVRYKNNLVLAEQYYTPPDINKTIEKREQVSYGLIADFEHNYLVDKNHSLKIKFNSNISFNNIVKDTKIETIGGHYPFFYRNGDVNYKEFQISGLVTFNTDENDLFTDIDNLTYIETIRQRGEKPIGATDLTRENFYLERKFKLKVLEWLNDDKPKLLKTPGEGNYIVRLSNISLSPVAGLSNMLHSFSATATEIADFNTFEELEKNGVIEL